MKEYVFIFFRVCTIFYSKTLDLLLSLHCLWHYYWKCLQKTCKIAGIHIFFSYHNLWWYDCPFIFK